MRQTSPRPPSHPLRRRPLVGKVTSTSVPAPTVAAHLDPAAVALDDALRDRQPEAAAADGDVAAAIEALEDAGLVLAADPGSGVLDGQRQALARRPCPTPPAGAWPPEYLIALSTMFSSAWMTAGRSTQTCGRSGGSSTISSNSSVASVGRNPCSASSTRSAGFDVGELGRVGGARARCSARRSAGCRSSCRDATLPPRAARRIPAPSWARCSGRSPACRRRGGSSATGVFSSWVTAATKSDFIDASADAGAVGSHREHERQQAGAGGDR